MILLDTDVVSVIIKGDELGETYFELVKGQPLGVSFMSAAELFSWAELRHWGERRRAELDWLLSNRYAVLGASWAWPASGRGFRRKSLPRAGRQRCGTAGSQLRLATSTCRWLRAIESISRTFRAFN